MHQILKAPSHQEHPVRTAPPQKSTRKNHHNHSQRPHLQRTRAYTIISSVIPPSTPNQTKLPHRRLPAPQFHHPQPSRPSSNHYYATITIPPTALARRIMHITKNGKKTPIQAHQTEMKPKKSRPQTTHSHRPAFPAAGTAGDGDDERPRGNCRNQARTNFLSVSARATRSTLSRSLSLAALDSSLEARGNQAPRRKAQAHPGRRRAQIHGRGPSNARAPRGGGSRAAAEARNRNSGKRPLLPKANHARRKVECLFLGFRVGLALRGARPRCIYLRPGLWHLLDLGPRSGRQGLKAHLRASFQAVSYPTSVTGHKFKPSQASISTLVLQPGMNLLQMLTNIIPQLASMPICQES